MKNLFLIALTMLFVSLSAKAQESKPRVALNVGIGNSYNLTSRNSEIDDYHALDGKISVVFTDKWFVGYAQSGSIYPNDLLKNTSPSLVKSRINNYSLVVGRKWNMGDRLYFTGSFNLGISEFTTRTSNESDWDDFFDSNSHTSFLAGTETGMGFNINQYLAVEGGVNYRRYFENDQLVMDTKDLNSLGLHVTLIGRLNLTK